MLILCTTVRSWRRVIAKHILYRLMCNILFNVFQNQSRLLFKKLFKFKIGSIFFWNIRSKFKNYFKIWNFRNIFSATHICCWMGRSWVGLESGWAGVEFGWIGLGWGWDGAEWGWAGAGVGARWGWLSFGKCEYSVHTIV